MLQNRRSFLTTSALASGSVLLPASPLSFAVPAGFRLTILATNWGFSGSYDEFCAKAKADGYDGIEVWLPAKANQQKALFDAIERHDLKFGLLAGVGSSDFKTHFEQFKKSVQSAVNTKPLFVNCHSGRDYFPFEASKKIFEFTAEVSAKTGIPISHETHRARTLFAAHITQQFMEVLPSLRLTLDISHWCCVHGSLLDDQQAAVDLALSRTDHIHSRVGFDNGPQVSDPRAPEWQQAMDTHFGWWDRVVEQKVKADQPLTMTTEFGPPSYMPTVPFTNQPITDLWAVNKHMKDLWQDRYRS